MVVKTVPIRMSLKLRDFLKKNGGKGESYEEIIWRLLGQKTLTKEQSKIIKAKYESSL